MKRISTLFTALAALLTVQSQAQFTENFETANEFTGSCWSFYEVGHLVYSVNTFFDFRIAGNGSLVTNPTTNESEYREVTTPTLSVTSTSFTVAFKYRLNTAIVGKATRTIEVGLQDANGYTYLDKITIDSKTTSPELTTSYNQTFTLSSTGAKRLVIRMGGGGGVGVTRVILDDLYASASARYTTNGGCNSAPVAIDDYFVSPLMTSFAGNVITNTVGGTDNEPNGESFSAVTIVAQPAAAQGTVTIDNNGNFTFTPAPGFTGGTVTFTYRLTDDGFTALTSNTATVTIDFPAPLVILPVKLISFGGELDNTHAQLNWAVAENESGAYFEVLRSSDGKNFTSAGIVFASSKAGTESYSFAEKAKADQATYYKLKMINKDRSVSYSNVIALKSAAAKTAAGITILQNPVASVLTFTYSATSATQGQVAIYNTLGVKVYSSRLTSQKGSNSVSLTLEGHLAAGTYILEVVNGTDRAVTRMIKR